MQKTVPNKKTALNTRLESRYAGLAYIAPWLIGFMIFQLYPFITSLYYSFTNFNMIKAPAFVGIQNYVNIFTKDKYFWNSLKVTLYYVLMAVPMKLAFALIIAMILNMKLRCINLFRTAYYLPSILGGSVAVSVLWRFLFSKTGVINALLASAGIQGPAWLGDTRTALFTVSLLTVWQFGSSMVIFLAGLKQIPQELYEAAEVDGIGRIGKFFRITLPMISSILFFNLLMQMVNAFQEFTGVFVITGGGPMYSTHLYGMMLYDNAFTKYKMGYASALSWILFIIILLFTALAFKSSSYWTYYEDGGDF